MFTDICGSVAQTQQLGDEGHMELLGEHNSIVRDELVANHGREVKHTGDGIMAAFNSVVSAVDFSVAVQRRIHQRNLTAHTPFHISIGISAGEPVTGDNDDLFGAAVQLAARLCASHPMATSPYRWPFVSSASVNRSGLMTEASTVEGAAGAYPRLRDQLERLMVVDSELKADSTVSRPFAVL